MSAKYKKRNAQILAYVAIAFIILSAGFYLLHSINGTTGLVIYNLKNSVASSQAALVNEKIISSNEEQVTVSSDSSSKNAVATATLPEEIPAAQENQIKIYQIVNGSKKLYTGDVTYIDKNKDSLIESISWDIPNESTSIYDIELTILTVQSYPAVNGNWNVIFATSGSANLTISGFNGTVLNYMNEAPDLDLLGLKCGEDNVNFTLINNDELFVENYSCDNNSTETSLVLSRGKHTLEFTFGDNVNYAYNFANPLVVNTNQTWCGEINQYDSIFVNSSVIISVCPYNASNTTTGYINITLGKYGNFTMVSTAKIYANGTGASGGLGCGSDGCTAYQGAEGNTRSLGVSSTAANGGGGGGGKQNYSSVRWPAGGGGGGFGGNGGNGGRDSTNATFGSAGIAYGSSSSLGLLIGSGGGGGASQIFLLNGSSGGGGVYINADSGIVAIAGNINADGTDNPGGPASLGSSGAGGGGSGGHILIRARSVNISNANIHANGGDGGSLNGTTRTCGGGGGGGGRIYIAYTTLFNTGLTESVLGGSAGIGKDCTTINATAGSAGTYTSANVGTLMYIENQNLYTSDAVVYTFSANTSGATNCTLYGDWSGTWAPNETKNVSVGVQFNFTGITFVNPNQLYTWGILCMDNYNSSKWGTNYSFLTGDLNTFVLSTRQTWCGEINQYKSILLTSTGIIDVCPFVAGNSSTGYLNITLAKYGNFTMLSGAKIYANASGAPGGVGCSSNNCQAYEGTNGNNSRSAGASSNLANGGGGGGGLSYFSTYNYDAGGGGGGFGGSGGAGGRSVGLVTPGAGGVAYGISNSLGLLVGSGGGGGAGAVGVNGAAGGGGIYIYADSGSISISGEINADGNTAAGNSNQYAGCGGGGSGGHVLLKAWFVNVSSANIHVAGGTGGSCAVASRSCGGGGGGGGTIYIAYSSFYNASFNPSVAQGSAGSSSTGSGGCTFPPSAGTLGIYNIAPAGGLIFILNQTNFTNNNLTYIMSAITSTDSNCTLWGNWSGLWAQNETKPTIANNAFNFTQINLQTSGDYLWGINCSDIFGNQGAGNNYTFTVVGDISPPTWSNNITYPTSGAIYTPNLLNQFNVSWTDNGAVSSVLIEHNFTGALTNYSVSGNAGNQYYYNYTLGAGSYVWREYANDLFNNWNITDQWAYSVSQAAPSLILLLNGNNGNITIEAGTSLNISSYRLIGEGTTQLYDNSVLVNSGTNLTNLQNYVSPSYHNITLIYPATQNYSQSSITSFVTVQDTTPPNIAIITPLNNDILGWTVQLQANITDLNLASVRYEIRNGSISSTLLSNGTMNNIGGNIFNSTFYTNSTWPYDSYSSNEDNLSLIIYANDTSGNLANSSTSLVLDNTIPSIQYIAPTQAGSFFNSNFNLNIFLSNHKLSYGNYTIYNVSTSLQANQTNLTTATFSWNNLVNITNLYDGNYSITVFAKDSSQPAANSNTKTSWFYLKRTIPNMTQTTASGWVAPTPANNSFSLIKTQTFNLTCNTTYLDSVWINFNGTINSTPTGSNGVNYWWTFSNLLGTYNYTGYCNDSAGNTQSTQTNILTVYYNVSYSSFGGATTDFANVPDITNVTNAVIENISSVKIAWNNPINALSMNFNANILTGDRFLFVNSSALDPTINSSANITFYNLDCALDKVIYYSDTLSDRASILAQNILCSGDVCSSFACNSGNITFTAAHFTGFAAGPNANLTINNSGPANAGIPIIFYAYYVNRTSGTFITGASCNISFSDNSNNLYLMSQQSDHYEYSKSFSSAGNYSYNVSCIRSDFSELNATDNFSINYYVLIGFAPSTPGNNSYIRNNYATINISLNSSSLNLLKFNWNGTNYTIYNDSLVLIMNFNNVSALGENNTQIKDLSKFGNDGTLVNHAKYTPSGRYALGILLDGIDDSVNISKEYNFDFERNSSFTLEAWIYTSIAANSTIFAKQQVSGNKGWLLSMNSSGSLSMYLVNTWPSNSIQVNSINTINNNSWNHLVMTYNGSSNAAGVAFYINGIKSPTSVLYNSLSSSILNSETVLVGARPAGDMFLNGTVDEIRIWNVSLSSSEVLQHYYSNLNKYAIDKYLLIINESNLSYGGYSYFGYAKDNSGSEVTTETRILNQDTVPPDQVTHLRNQSQGYTWIYFTWTNPSDPEFNATLIYINGTNIVNLSTPINYLNDTSLSCGTTYNITIFTMDNAGNINAKG